MADGDVRPVLGPVIVLIGGESPLLPGGKISISTLFSARHLQPMSCKYSYSNQLQPRQGLPRVCRRRRLSQPDSRCHC